MWHKPCTVTLRPRYVHDIAESYKTAEPELINAYALTWWMVLSLCQRMIQIQVVHLLWHFQFFALLCVHVCVCVCMHGVCRYVYLVCVWWYFESSVWELTQYQHWKDGHACTCRAPFFCLLLLRWWWQVGIMLGWRRNHKVFCGGECHPLPHPNIQQVIHGVSKTHAAVLEKQNQPLHFSDLLLQYRSFHHLTLLPDLVAVD